MTDNFHDFTTLTDFLTTCHLRVFKKLQLFNFCYELAMADLIMQDFTLIAIIDFNECMLTFRNRALSWPFGIVCAANQAIRANLLQDYYFQNLPLFSVFKFGIY